MAKKKPKGERPFVLMDDDEEEAACPIPDEDGWIRLKKKRAEEPQREKRSPKDARKK